MYVCQLLWRGRFIQLVLGMESFFRRYKRIIIALVLSLVFMFGGEVCMAYNLHFTGLLFIVVSVLIIAYTLFFWILSRKTKEPFSQPWTAIERIVAPILSGALCISGIIESNPDKPDFKAVFILVLVYTVIYVAVQIWNYYRQKKGAAKLSRSFINKLIFWCFAIGVGRIIILIEEYGDTDALVIVAIFYFPLLFFVIARWVLLQMKAIINLKNEKAKTELLHLKSQVNPHFFFNTLNNLYGLVGTDTEKAQALILKLSDMMRYSIYEGDKEFVTLEEEAEYLQQYIELHQMRYRKSIDVQFNVDIQEGHTVMPLLFLILLENAFKHGVENLRANAYVHASLKTENGNISFEIENNFDPEIKEQPGIGLQNLKRRLELGYPKTHSLVLNENLGVYKAQLILTQK